MFLNTVFLTKRLSRAPTTQDFFNEAVNFSSHIDFSQSQVFDETVSVFETTIRYVGGLLSAFQLSGSKHQVLVDKAQEVADKMAFAWVGVSSR